MCIRDRLHTIQGLQRRLHSAARVKRETRILPIGVGAFMPKFYGNGVIPAKMLIPFDRLIALQLCRWKFLDDETLEQTFNVFC